MPPGWSSTARPSRYSPRPCPVSLYGIATPCPVSLYWLCPVPLSGLARPCPVPMYRLGTQCPVLTWGVLAHQDDAYSLKERVCNAYLGEAKRESAARVQSRVRCCDAVV
eukprot:2532647-Rhodomonas_salina.5